MEPVTGIPEIVRAPVFPGDDEKLLTPVKKKTKASDSTQTLKDTVLTPSLTRRKITYTPAKEDVTETGTKSKVKKKKKKKKKKKYLDDSEDEVSSTSSELPLGPDELNPVESIDLTKSPLAITGN